MNEQEQKFYQEGYAKGWKDAMASLMPTVQEIKKALQEWADDNQKARDKMNIRKAR